MQEEEQAETGDLFNLAEENFFRHRLKTLYPKIDEEGIKTAIGLLTTQKLVNCPCSVHTEERGYEWIVFRRQPDWKIYSTDDDEEDNSTTKSISDDDVFFSAEAEDALLDQRADYTEPGPDGKRNLEKENSSTDVSDGKENTRPQMSNQPRESFLHSREKRSETSKSSHQSHQKKKKIRNPRKKRKKKKKSNLLALVRAL